MGGLEIIIKKSDVPHNAEAVREDGEFIGIAEMAVDVLLFCVRAGSGLCGREAVSHLIRVNIRVVFIVSPEAADKGIEGFGVVFRDIKLDAGGIEGKHGGKGSINSLADGFGEVHHLLEHELNVFCKAEFETGKERGIRDFGEAAEIPQFLADVEQEDEQGIGRDGEYLLQDKCGKEAGKGIIPFAPKVLVKSVIKDRRDKCRDIEMIF